VRFERLGDGECGPVLARRVLMWKVGSSSVRQEVVLYHDSPRIDFRTEIDWREDRKLLRVYFPLAVLARSATYEIAFGTIDRPTRTTNPFDLAKFEVPFHRWFDVSEPGYGVSILNDGKYGGAVKDSVASISLLKAPKFPDPTSDMGRHVFTYSLLPHQGDWRDAGTFAEALILNTPLEAFPGRPGDASAAWLDVSRPGVQVEALKKAEDGKGYILRLVDYYGRTGRVRVTLPRAPRSVRPCTITEEASDEDVSVRGAAISFTMRPYAVRSFRILFA
jgi:alpha-mannosidase